MITKPSAVEFLEKIVGPMSFGIYLTAARVNMDMSQAELARKLKVSRSMICDIEKGRVLVSPTLAIKVARMAGFPTDLAVQYCLQDQLRRAKIKMKVDVKVA